jgi:hypothetical protein
MAWSGISRCQYSIGQQWAMKTPLLEFIIAKMQ